MERAKGILYAALSSSTFGLAPLFTLLLLGLGYSCLLYTSDAADE